MNIYNLRFNDQETPCIHLYFSKNEGGLYLKKICLNDPTPELLELANAITFALEIKIGGGE